MRFPTIFLDQEIRLTGRCQDRKNAFDEGVTP
jgi:hypothetical protein